MDKNMEKDNIALIKAHYIKEVLSMINLMDKDSYQYLRESTKVYFYKEVFMETAYFVGKMDLFTKETIKMIKNKVMENMQINKEKRIKVTGKTVLDMEKVHSLIKTAK